MKATSNLAVIRRIRFNVKTRHRIYPDTLCATKWLETKPLLCKVYTNALSRLRFFRRMYVCVYLRVATGNNRRFWIRDDILLYGGRLCGSGRVCPPFSANSPRLGRKNPSSPKTKKYERGYERCPFHFFSP